MRLVVLTLCLCGIWVGIAGAQGTDAQAEIAVLKARVAQLEAQLAEQASCGAATGPEQATVETLMGKLGAQEEAHAWAMLGLGAAPRVWPDSVLTSVVPGEYLLLTNQTPEALGLDPAQVLFRYAQALDGFAARLSDLERDALLARGDVQVVENGRVFAAQTADQGAAETTAGGPGAGPGRDVQNPEVEVFLFDTGIRGAHRALLGRVAGQGFSTFDNGIAGEDCSGHGTHVAARIAGRVLGVSDRARLVSVKVMDAFGGGDVATVIAGIDWVLTRGSALPSVANMSFARKQVGDGPDPLHIAVERLIDSGTVVVVAAGNAAQDVALFSPARVPGAITVGSVHDGRLSDFSNAGVGVDVYAPGEAVQSASIRDVCGLREMSGTSMAAPYVSGLVADMLADGMVAAEVQGALRTRAEVVPTRALVGELQRWVLSADEVAGVLCPDP